MVSTVLANSRVLSAGAGKDSDVLKILRKSAYVELTI